MMKVMLLDDELNANEILQDLLMEIGDVVILNTFTRPTLFLQELNRLSSIRTLPDVVFIDIEMPEMNGLEVADRVKAQYPDVEVVFVTAYSEYAIQAFELHSLDYLLKPANRKRVEKTLARIKSLLHTKLAERNHDKRDLNIQSLGEFSLSYRQGKERLKWRTGKVKELCAYLLHHYSRPTPAHELMDKLFAETDEEKAKVNFYTSMSYLRKSLKEIGCPDIIQKNENGYVIQLEELAWDYLDVKSILSDRIIHKKQDTWSAIEQLMNVYKGDYFAEFESRDFVIRRQELRQQVFIALQDAWERYRLEGNHGRVLQCLMKMAQVAPDSEKVAIELIQFYQDQGHRLEAIQYYENFIKHLYEEFGIAPSREFMSEIDRIFG